MIEYGFRTAAMGLAWIGFVWICIVTPATSVLAGQETEGPIDISESCQSTITPNGDGDGNGNQDDRLISTKTDSAGNKVEIWCLKRGDNPTNGGDNPGGFQFGVKYVPAEGSAVWVGRCKFLPARNAGVCVKDENGVFKSIRWKNRSTVSVREKDENIEHRDLWEYEVGGNLKATPQKRDFGRNRDYDAGWGEDPAHETKTGSPPTDFKDLIEDFSTGTTRIRIAGEGCMCCEDDALGISFSGQAQGGSLDLALFEIPVTVPTLAGETAAQVAANVAAAINAAPSLGSLGIHASTEDRLLWIAQVGGENAIVVVNDPGLTARSEIPIQTDLTTPVVLGILAILLAIAGTIASRRY